MMGIKHILMVAAIIFAAAGVGIAAEEYSDDYIQGYKDASGLFKAAGWLDGSLATYKLLLDTMDNVARDPDSPTVIVVFADAFVHTLSETYNEYAMEYNSLTTVINAKSIEILGDDADAVMFERAELFW